MSPTRRQVLKWGGVGFGALAGVGVVGRAVLIPPRPSAELAPVPDLAAQLFEMLGEDERAEAVFHYEHPLRQYHNRGVDTGGAWAFFLSRESRRVLVDLVHAALSESGKFEEAIKAARKALKFADEEDEPQVQKLLVSITDGQPFRPS